MNASSQDDSVDRQQPAAAPSTVAAAVRRNLAIDAAFATRLRDLVLLEQQDGTVDWDKWAVLASERNVLRAYSISRYPREAATSSQRTETALAGVSLALLFATLVSVFIGGATLIFAVLGILTLTAAMSTYLVREHNDRNTRRAARRDEQWISLVRETYTQQVRDVLNAERDPATTAPADGATHRNTAPSTREIQHAFDELKKAWGAYVLDREAFLLTMPALRMDSVPETRAYQDSMSALEDALDGLSPSATNSDREHAAVLADSAWHAWHTAIDRAAEIGLDNYSPTERAALTRLATLVERISHPSTPTTERSTIIRDIERCLTRIDTTPITWTDLRALPELSHALPALPR